LKVLKQLVLNAVANKISICGFFLFISIISESQTNELPDISADRPGMSTPPSIVEPKCLQVETGFSYDNNRLEKPFQEEIFYNSTQFRYGINKNSELRLYLSYTRLKTDGVNITGFNPLTLGTKLFISEGNGILPKTSFLINLTLPCFGEKNFRPSKLAPAIYILMQNDITKNLNVCYNIGIEYYGESANPTTFAAISIGYNFTNRLNGSMENYNWFSNETKSKNFIDFGLAYLIGRKIQIDLSGSMSVQDMTKYIMINTGLPLRINN
jgi:hypothetical protein